VASPADRRRPAVQADVARLAGVSAQTVSRVINDSGYVGARTRDRVLAAMRELNYRPNTAAQALVTGRTRTLGVVSVDPTTFGPASILLALERSAHAHGYAVSVTILERLDAEAVLDGIERLERQGVDGILLNPGPFPLGPGFTRTPTDTPMVAIVDAPSSAVSVVSHDQQAAAASATRLLLDLGHRTVAHIAGPADWLAGRQRIEGWQAELAAAGVEAPPPLIGDWTARSGYELGRQIAADPTITAVFAANDQMSLGLLRALHLAGRAVPRDVSLIGFDDIPEARYLTPPLTTVKQDFDAAGREAMRLLLHAIDTPDEPPQRLTLTPELVVRESTARAPQDAAGRPPARAAARS
jgi:DNA-binding LacI/PurR family transcriptional regulator